MGEETFSGQVNQELEKLIYKILIIAHSSDNFENFAQRIQTVRKDTLEKIAHVYKQDLKK